MGGIHSLSLSPEQLEKSLRKVISTLNSQECEYLGEYIDKAGTGQVNSRMWMECISDDQLHLSQLLQPFIKVINHHGYNLK